jgi:F-type H+-transporting ATPase subunit b
MFDLLAAAGGEAAEAKAFGIDAGGYIALAMVVVLLIMLWAGVPKIVAKILDARIEGIRTQLEEAKSLRAEAEKLRDEYAAKTGAADQEIAALRANAEAQAEEIVRKAKDDATALIARRERMAKDKIAAAERAAVEELRAKAAEAAATAARGLIAEGHDAKADAKLVDKAISGI